MATKTLEAQWEEKQKDVIIKIFEKHGMRKDLQMLKIGVMGYGYSGLFNEEDAEKLEKRILKYDLSRYPDEELLKHIELLSEDEKSVINVKHGIGKDGIRISTKKVSEKLGISSRKIPYIQKRALTKLKESYREFSNNQNIDVTI